GEHITLRLKSGHSLEHNASYTIVIDGIRDLSGNLPWDSSVISEGQLTTVFQGDDLLAPRADRTALTFADTGETVTPATQFKQGSVYRFQVHGEDNYKSSEELRFSYRVSADGGLTFLNNWTAIQKRQSTHTFELGIDPRFTNSLTL